MVTLRRVAPGLVTKGLAEARAKAFEDRVRRHVLAAMTADFVEVRVTPDGIAAARRKVDRAELRDALLDLE